MKFTKVLLGLSVFSVLSFAMDVSYFAGIGVGHSDWTVKRFCKWYEFKLFNKN